MAHNTTDPSLLGDDHQPADAGDEAFALKVPHEADPSWVELGWLSALLGALQDTPPAPTDPAGGELAVGLSGDLYYIASGAPQKSDDSLGDQLWSRMGWDEQDYVTNLEKKQDSVDDTPVSLG